MKRKKKMRKIIRKAKIISRVMLLFLAGIIIGEIIRMSLMAFVTLHVRISYIEKKFKEENSAILGIEHIGSIKINNVKIQDKILEKDLPTIDVTNKYFTIKKDESKILFANSRGGGIRPFVTNNFSSIYFNSEYEKDYVTRVVMGECGNQPYEGMLAVCQVILNRCEITGMSAYEVVTEPKQFTSPRESANENIKKAVEDVFFNGVRIWDFKVTSFHSGDFPKSWDKEKYIFVQRIGGHDFYTWYNE